MQFLLYILFFMIGSVIGSFTNMLAYRFVAVKPIWGKSRSYCPKCEHTLKWYNLIPVFSYIFQRGKCTFCKEKIHVRYFYLEVFSGLLFVFIMHNTPVTYENIAFFFIILMFLIPILIIDVMVHLIYDGYLKFLILMTAVVLYINEYVYELNLVVDLPTFKDGVIGFIVIYVALFIFNKVGGFVLYGDYRFDLLGMGDVKLMAWMFMILGDYTATLLLFFVSSFIGILLYASVSLLFHYINLKKKGESITFAIKDSLEDKTHNLKIRISPVVNNKIYNLYKKDKKLLHTFLVGDIDKKESIIKIQSGKFSLSIKVDRDTVNKIINDKKKVSENGVVIDYYITCQFVFNEEGNLEGFEYVSPGDYELYMQSILRTKNFGSTGVPFAPSLVLSFIIMLLWGNQFVPFVQGLFIS